MVAHTHKCLLFLCLGSAAAWLGSSADPGWMWPQVWVLADEDRSCVRWLGTLNLVHSSLVLDKTDSSVDAW